MEDKTITSKMFLNRRDEYIIEKCSGKSVLHIGACDWPYTKEKYDDGILLYQKIDTVAKSQIGIDLNEKMIKYLNNKKWRNSRIMMHDMNKVYKIDIKPDIIIFGETLEHLMNLEIALLSLRKIMMKNTELIISVPNAFSFANVVLAFRGRENQHSDHKVAFTYKTFNQLLIANGFNVNEFYFSWLAIDQSKLNWKGYVEYKITQFLSSRFPLFSGTLVAVVTIDDTFIE